jgi:regulator of protease activity HflC (stomatin/prohibitin superfamily)
MNFLSTIADFLLRLPFWAVVYQEYNGILLRGGKYKKSLLPGFYFKWPIYDEVFTEKVNEQQLDLDNQTVVTTDGKIYSIKTDVRYQITDIAKAILNTANYKEEIEDRLLDSIQSWGSQSSSAELNTCFKLRQQIYEDALDELDDIGLDLIEIRVHESAPTRVFRFMGDPIYTSE